MISYIWDLRMKLPRVYIQNIHHTHILLTRLPKNTNLILGLNCPEKFLSITNKFPKPSCWSAYSFVLWQIAFPLIKSLFRIQRSSTTPCPERVNPFFLKSPVFLISERTQAKKLKIIQSSFSSWAFISYFTTVSLIPTFSLGCSVCQTHSGFKIPADPLRCYTVHDRVWQACALRP